MEKIHAHELSRWIIKRKKLLLVNIMAQRRMLSLKIVDTDAFLDMPSGSQLLYFHLSMRADDDGFVANPKKIMRIAGSQDDEYKVLVVKRFIIPFESGVCVIKHWLVHNLIRSDRYTETQYVREKSMLVIDEQTKKYSLNKEENHVIPNGNQMAPQVRLELGKVREEEREGTRTPSKIAKDFFGLRDETPLEFYKEKVPEHILRPEVQKFILYWTEPNKSGTRQRWELERTFDVHRRLATWFSRVKSYQPNTKNRTIT